MLRSLQEKVDPKYAALLVVDMQNDFCHDKGIFARLGLDISLTKEMAPKLLYFISEARKHKITIIFIKMIWSESTFSEVAKERLFSRFPDLSQIPCLEGSWGAQYYVVEPRDDDIVVIKHRFSAFIDTDLDVILRTKQIKTLIMTGVATNVCVESTARDGFMKDYYIVFLGNCTASIREDHEATLRNIGRSFGVVHNSEEIIQAWQNIKQTS